MSTPSVAHDQTLRQAPSPTPSSQPSTARFQYAEIGSISSGTLRTQDLLPAFLDALEELAPRRAAKLRREYGYLFAAIDAMADLTDDLEEHAEYLVNETLPDALNDYAPPYTYFGAHEGDGADFGFLISWDTLDEAVKDGSILKLNSGDPWPKRARHYEYVLEVSDHGNATLFNPRSRREVWSCV